MKMLFILKSAREADERRAFASRALALAQFGETVAWLKDTTRR